MADTKAKPTAEQRDHAMLHATVWERVADEFADHMGRHDDAGDRNRMAQYARCIGGEYRRVANGAEIDL